MAGWKACRRRRYRVHNADGETRAPAAPTGPPITISDTPGHHKHRCKPPASTCLRWLRLQRLGRLGADRAPEAGQVAGAAQQRGAAPPQALHSGTLGFAGPDGGVAAAQQALESSTNHRWIGEGMGRAEASCRPGHLAPAPHRLIAASACAPPNGTPGASRPQCLIVMRSPALLTWYNPA